MTIVRLIAKLLCGALVVIITAGIARSQGCQGNGCPFITISNRGGCMLLINSHDSSAIKVWGAKAIPTYVWTVYARSEQIADTPQGCMRNWYSQGHFAEIQ